MGQFVENSDSWVIGKFESFSHWTQQWFGVGSATWQRLCFVLAFAGFVNCALWKDTDGFSRVLNWLLLFFIPLRFLASFFIDYHRGGSARTMNPEKIQNQKTRVVMFSIGLCFSWLDWPGLWFQWYCTAVYFSACDDLPPGISRLKQVWRSLRAVRIPVIVPDQGGA